MAKKLGLALGAGGSRGVAHIGFLRALEEANIRPDFIAGTSMGSIVGACYAKGLKTSYMEEIVTKIKFSDIFDLSFNPVGNAALLRSEKMRKQLSKYIGNITFGQLEIPFCCVATDVLTGDSVVLKGKDDDVCSAVVASSSIPLIFKPVALGENLLIDGGVTCRVPIKSVRELGAEVVVAVDVLGKVKKCDKKYNAFALVRRVCDIADSELTKYKVKEQKPEIFIEPDLGDMSQYKFKDIAEAIEKGYQTGKQYIDKILKLIEE